MNSKKHILVASIVTGIIISSLLVLRSRSISDEGTWSDLEETNHGYSGWGLEGGESSVPYTWSGKSISLAVAIEAMQEQGVITAKWVVGDEHLLNKFYDISLTGETKRDVALSFYNWVNNNFSIEIQEQNVEMEILSLSPPEISSKFSKSEQSSSSLVSKTINGQFGVVFTGTTSSELCSFLRDRSGKPVMCMNETGLRYDFFLSSPWADEVLDAAAKIGFKLKKEKSVIPAVVIKKRAAK